MQTPGRKRLMTLGLSGALALGLVGASGIALADTSGDGAPPPAAADGQHPNRPAFKGLQAIFEASDLDRTTFAQGFSDGMTVGQVLEANGVDQQALIDQVLANVEDRLDQGVAEGKVNPDRATEMLAKAESGLNALMDLTPPPPGDRPGHGDGEGDGEHEGRPHRGAALQLAADTIGLSPDELRTALQDGSTLADIAVENGVPVDDVIQALLQPIFDHIDQAVADGRIDEASGQQKKDEATARVTDFVNNGPQQPPSDTPAS